MRLTISKLANLIGEKKTEIEIEVRSLRKEGFDVSSSYAVLRELAKFGWVEKVDKGTYSLTPEGHLQMLTLREINRCAEFGRKLTIHQGEVAIIDVERGLVTIKRERDQKGIPNQSPTTSSEDTEGPLIVGGLDSSAYALLARLEDVDVELTLDFKRSHALLHAVMDGKVDIALNIPESRVIESYEELRGSDCVVIPVTGYYAGLEVVVENDELITRATTLGERCGKALKREGIVKEFSEDDRPEGIVKDSIKTGSKPPASVAFASNLLYSVYETLVEKEPMHMYYLEPNYCVVNAATSSVSVPDLIAKFNLQSSERRIERAILESGEEIVKKYKNLLPVLGGRR